MGAAKVEAEWKKVYTLEGTIVSTLNSFGLRLGTYTQSKEDAGGCRGKMQQLEKREKTLVFRDEGIRGGFTQIPTKVLRDSRLTGNERVLYGLLLSYAWQEGECFPGQCRLAKDMGVDKRTVGTGLGKLRKMKLISWKRQGLGKTNVYYIEKLVGYLGGKQMVDKP